MLHVEASFETHRCAMLLRIREFSLVFSETITAVAPI
jgi:hypothetical protein